jgi:hypothetical protein
MKMFLTRFGQNSRMVVCGDPKQVDLPGGVAASGLADAVGRLEGVDGIGVVHFSRADVVRHPIVGRIVEAYEGNEAERTGFHHPQPLLEEEGVLFQLPSSSEEGSGVVKPAPTQPCIFCT